MEVLGLDIGFGFTKATNGREHLMFKSLIGEAEEIQFLSDFAMAPLTESLHVTIDGKEYFVGDYAEKQSNVRHYTLDQDKLITDFLKILSLTITGLFSETFVPINVVSGLPVVYFREYKEKFSKILLGSHEIVYRKPDGSEAVRRININKIRMIPQPFGSLLNHILNERGKMMEKDLARQKVGVVDIGFNTTDYVLFDKLQYINRGSRTINLGISDCFRKIAEKIRQKSGLGVELYRLYTPVEFGSIRMKGQEYNLAKTKEQIFTQTAEVIANEINQTWADDWDMESIFLTGGGSMELANYLKPLLNGQIIMPPADSDARINNVQGFLKFARHLWPDPGIPETQTEQQG